MNRVILKRSNSNQKNITISDSETLTHLFEVLKVEIDDTLKISLLDEGLGEARIISKTSSSVELEIQGPLSTQKRLERHLLVGISRPPTMKKILEHATSMGVTHFHFFKAELSEKSYLQSKIYQNENIEKLLLLGMAQSAKVFNLPKVELYQSLDEAVEQLPTQKYILSLEANSYFSQSDQLNEPIALAIGPERGWTNAEERQLIDLNFIPRTISSHTLRVEMATFSALAQIELFNSSSSQA